MGATVATSEATTSVTFTDLATAGPTAATVTIGASGKALVTLTSGLAVSSNGVAAIMGFAVSGATTVAASDTQVVRAERNSGDLWQYSATYLVSGLTAGSNTFTAKYRSETSGTSVTFSNRNIIVIPLP